MPVERRNGARKARPAARRKVSEKDELLAKITRALGVSREEAELRALRELSNSLELNTESADATPRAAEGATPRSPEAASPRPREGALPQRLYLHLDGRMPVEVIDLPTVLGSSKNCTVWVNSPQIETRHLMITRGDDGWLLEDLGTEHGTFFGQKKVQRRLLQHGDEFRLAGYLRLRTELR